MEFDDRPLLVYLRDQQDDDITVDFLMRMTNLIAYDENLYEEGFQIILEDINQRIALSKEPSGDRITWYRKQYDESTNKIETLADLIQQAVKEVQIIEEYREQDDNEFLGLFEEEETEEGELQNGNG